MKRFFLVFGSAFLLLAVVGSGCTHQVTIPKQSASLSTLQPDPDKYLHLVIIGTNDVHGFIRTKTEVLEGQTVLSSGAEWFAGYIRILEKKFGDRLILLDGGDIFQGTLESNRFLGKPMIELYNLLPMRAAAVGNHEFDYGPENKESKDRLGALKTRMKEARFPFLASNIYYRNTQKPWKEENLFPHVLFAVEGVKIGVFGLTTESTPEKTRPQNVASLRFGSMLEASKRETVSLRKKGADLVLVVAHEGGSAANEPIPLMLSRLPKGAIDAAVTGHSHTKVNQFMNGTPVIQSMSRGQYFGRIDLYVDRQTRRVATELTRIHEPTMICGTHFAQEDHCNTRIVKEAIAKDPGARARFFPVRAPSYEGQTVAPDSMVLNALNPYFQDVDRVKNEYVTEATGDFGRAPSGEHLTCVLYADMLKAAFPEARVTYLNGGGIRRNLLAGKVTYGDLFEIMPFDNSVALVKMKGKDLRLMLELGVSGEVQLPCVSGVRFGYRDNDQKRFLRDLNGDGKKENWERNRLAWLKWSDGRAIQDNEEFFLVTHDFLVDGGDHMGPVFEKMPQSRKQILDSYVLDAVVNQLRMLNRETISPSADLRMTVVE